MTAGIEANGGSMNHGADQGKPHNSPIIPSQEAFQLRKKFGNEELFSVSAHSREHISTDCGLSRTLQEGQQYPLNNEILSKNGMDLSANEKSHEQHLHVANAMEVFQNLSMEDLKLEANLMTWRSQACRM